MLTPQSVHDAYSDAIAARIERLHADDVRAWFIAEQERTSRILCHGASDRAELDQLARMCAVPRTVLAFDVEAVR